MKQLLSLLEPEEFVGKHWHTLIARDRTEPHFPAAAVTLETMRPSLGVLFRGLGGAPGLRFANAGQADSDSRPTWRQRLGGERRVTLTRRDGQALYLPPTVDAFDDRDLNRSLYLWLTAFFVHLPVRPCRPACLGRDIAFLRDVRAAQTATLRNAPGLAAAHARLCAAVLQARSVRRLPPAEAAIEQAIARLLGADDGGPYWPLITAHCAIALPPEPAHYRPFLAVPLWGEAIEAVDALPPAANDEAAAGAPSDGAAQKALKARRKQQDQTERRDYLALNRFEKMLSLIESMNINRAVEDDDEDGARKAAEDADEIVLSAHHRRASTRLKLDLALAPADAADAAPLPGLAYPEWDWRKQVYRPAYCRVLAAPAPAAEQPWHPGPDVLRRIRRVRRQFEALRPRRVMLHAQTDGDDLDLEALVRARADMAGGGTISDRIHVASVRQARDLAVALLVDVSLSCESWIGDCRVIDVAKEAALVFTHALDACGDPHALFAFTSRGNKSVRVDTVKDFSEPHGTRTTQRIAALQPGQYTRMGAAIRHVAAELAKQPAQHRLLLMLTDGKPNDIDHYEGRYGLEDTRRAIGEARRDGARVFGMTIDATAQSYFPVLFGRGGFAIVNEPARLPAALAVALRHMVIA